MFPTVRILNGLLHPSCHRMRIVLEAIPLTVAEVSPPPEGCRQRDRNGAVMWRKNPVRPPASGGSQAGEHVEGGGGDPGDDGFRPGLPEGRNQTGSVNLIGDDEDRPGPVAFGSRPAGLDVASVGFKPRRRRVQEPDGIGCLNRDDRATQFLRLCLDDHLAARDEFESRQLRPGEVVAKLPTQTVPVDARRGVDRRYGQALQGQPATG